MEQHVGTVSKHEQSYDVFYDKSSPNEMKIVTEYKGKTETAIFSGMVHPDDLHGIDAMIHELHTHLEGVCWLS
jgi:hypothetical protein